MFQDVPHWSEILKPKLITKNHSQAGGFAQFNQYVLTLTLFFVRKDRVFIRIVTVLFQLGKNLREASFLDGLIN